MLFMLEDFMRTQVMYALRPWLTVALGLFALAGAGQSVAGSFFGFILVLCGFAIFYMRFTRGETAKIRR